RLRGRPALQPPHGPHARGGRVRLVIVRRQLERRDDGDVGGRPARLRREAGRLDQPLAEAGGPPQGGERAHLGREHGEVGRVASPTFERLLQLAAVIAHQMAAERQIEPIDRPAAEQAAIGPECGEGRDHFAGAIERQRALRDQPQRLRIRRDGGHLARGLEGALPVALALNEHPREVMLVEGSEATRSALHRVCDRVRRRVLPQVHMLVRREDQREPEGRVLLRGAPEVLDGATRDELHHAIQSLDELLVSTEAAPNSRTSVWSRTTARWSRQCRPEVREELITDTDRTTSTRPVWASPCVTQSAAMCPKLSRVESPVWFTLTATTTRRSLRCH